MALYGRSPNPDDLLRQVKPPTGPPVVNMGGIPKQPLTVPKPAVTSPTVAGGPPGPEGMRTGGFTGLGAKSAAAAAGALQSAGALKSAAPAPVSPDAAQRYFNSFGPEYQKNVLASFKPGDDLNKWFSNAVAAGAVNPDGTRKTAVPAAGGGGGGGRGNAAAAAPVDPLEAQISDYITKALGGGAGAYDDAMVSRYKAAAKSAAEGQRRATVDMGNEDLAARGLFRSGLGARMAADASRGAGASYTQAVADIMNQKAAADQAARESALQGALGLYQTKTGNALQAQELAARNRGGGGGPKTFAYMDPETGQTYELPMELLG